MRNEDICLKKNAELTVLTASIRVGEWKAVQSQAFLRRSTLFHFQIL